MYAKQYTLYNVVYTLLKKPTELGQATIFSQQQLLQHLNCHYENSSTPHTVTTILP